MTLIKLGSASEADVELDRLVETRMLVQANSGGGKSWALRRLLEQSNQHVQCVVIDVDDEFHTLRESFDFALAGKGGECAAVPERAVQLAHHVLELGISIVVNVSDLDASSRRRFVQLFLDAMMSAPKALWHPVLVVIDEAHVFCPEGHHADGNPAKRTSADAVIDLMTRGRKRGFCGVLATQRISKLNKDAAAECNNKLIGRCVQDIDMRRAAAELGIDRHGQAALRSLAPGVFFSFGPAFSHDELRRVVIGTVVTTHHHAGDRTSRPTPPRGRVLEVLGKLGEIADPVVLEIKDPSREVTTLQARITELETEVRKRRIEYKPVIQTAALDELVRGAAQLQQVATAISAAANALLRFAHELKTGTPPIPTEEDVVDGKRMADGLIAAYNRRNEPARAPAAGFDATAAPARGDASEALERKLLTVLAQRGSLPKHKVLLFANYASSGRTSKAFAELRRRGRIDVQGGRVCITSQGAEWLGPVPPRPLGADLRMAIKEGDLLDPTAQRILDALVTKYPQGVGVSKGVLLETVGLASSGRTSRAFARLVALEYAVYQSSGVLRASPDLFA